MKTKLTVVLIKRALLLALLTTLHLQLSAQAQNTAFTYQGRLNDGTSPANGNYEILFRPFGVFTGGSQLTIPNIRFVAVSNGLFTTAMDFGPAIFAGGPVYLQLEVRTNAGASYTTLVPRQQLTPTPYAIFSGIASTVPNGAIATAQLAADAVTTGKLAPGAVTSATLADTLALGNSTNVSGRLDVFRTAANTRAISLIGSNSQVIVRGNNGEETVQILGSSWGQLFLNDDQPGNDRAVTLSALGPLGGGFLSLHNTNGATRGWFSGQSTTGSGEFRLHDANGTSTVEMTGAEGSGSGSQLVMKQANGTTTIQLDAEVGSGGGGYLRLYKGDGSVGLTLQADVGGESKVTTQVLQITGGSDLSEQFDIKAGRETLQPGMLVCIDSEHPGQLITSTKAYDRTVAGVMSGAGGVKPGMLMGQQGTAADGKHPVALSGRVYCEADASNGPIHPGDLLTTSNTPGHAMKVTDYPKAQGAIIGKAMSSLDKGQGLVLVLVSLQ